MKKFIVSILVALSVAASAFSATKYSAPQLVYSLPKTVLSIEITLTRTEIKVGPYYKYSERLLAIKDAATEDKVEWTLNQVRVKPVGIPDKDKTFKLKTAKSIVLNDKGIICGLNVDNESVKQENKDEFAEPIVIRLDDNNFDPSAYYEEQLEANSIGRMAESAAKQIYRIGDSRASLATGDMEHMPADGESMKMMFDQMDSQEKALMALFEGKKRTTEVKKILLYVPAKKSVKDELVFRVSKLGGVVEKDDLTGDPVYLTITAKKNETPSAQTNKGEFFYNMPGSARVQLTYNNQLIFDADMQIAQMGSIQALPSAYKSAKLIFDPTTGALIKIGK